MCRVQAASFEDMGTTYPEGFENPIAHTFLLMLIRSQKNSPFMKWKINCIIVWYFRSLNYIFFTGSITMKSRFKSYEDLMVGYVCVRFLIFHEISFLCNVAIFTCCSLWWWRFFFFGLLFVSCWWSIHNCFYGLLFNALFYSFHLVDFVAHPGFTMMFTYILDNVGWVLVNGPSTVIRHVDSDTPQIPQARIHIFSRKFLFI